jgi:hypothetical protein
MLKRKLSSVLTDIRANVVPIALFQSILRPASKNEEEISADLLRKSHTQICRKHGRLCFVNSATKNEMRSLVILFGNSFYVFA